MKNIMAWIGLALTFLALVIWGSSFAGGGQDVAGKMEFVKSLPLVGIALILFAIHLSFNEKH